jgi:hypothetical protein
MDQAANLNRWAKHGASVRLREIEEELASIYKAFPDLKGQRSLAQSGSSTGQRRPARFSAEGKRAISEGMRKYWARRKAAAAKTARAATK